MKLLRPLQYERGLLPIQRRGAFGIRGEASFELRTPSRATRGFRSIVLNEVMTNSIARVAANGSSAHKYLLMYLRQDLRALVISLHMHHCLCTPTA